MNSRTSIHKLSILLGGGLVALALSGGALAQHSGGGGHASGAAGGGHGGFSAGYGYHGGTAGYGYRGGYGYGGGYRGGYGYYGGYRGYGYYGGGYRGWGGWGCCGWGWGWGGIGLGMYFATLPLYYSTYYWGGVPYYYANDVYYSWDPNVQQYVTVAPPAGLQAQVVPAPAGAGGSPNSSSDLMAYPKNGQTPEQQSKDKFECHQWAVGQSGFDPTTGAAAANKHNDYMRAQAACLEGRGYSVQ